MKPWYVWLHLKVKVKVTLLIPEGRCGCSFRRGHLNIQTDTYKETSVTADSLKHHENRHGQVLARLTEQDLKSKTR